MHHNFYRYDETEKKQMKEIFLVNNRMKEGKKKIKFRYKDNKNKCVSASTQKPNSKARIKKATH